MKTPQRLLVVASLILLIISCEKEKVVFVEKPISWSKHDNFLNGHQIQMNSYATNDNLFLFGTTLFTKFSVVSGDSNQVYPETSYNRLDYPIQYKLPIGSINNAAPTESYVTIRSNKEYLLNQTLKRINMYDIDSNFWRFDFPPYWMSECMILNGNNQCLIPYNTHLPNSSAQVSLSARLCILEIHRDSYNQVLDTLVPVPIPIDSNLGGCLSLHTFDGNFYACLSKATLRISPDYNVSLVSNEKLYQIFKYKDALYGVGINYLFKSDDNGLNWYPLLQVSESASFNNYQVINNELIAFRDGQILHLIIENNTIQEREIMNDGLEDTEITSISQFKGKVYVTSFSGVFTKDLSAFFTYK